MKELNSAANPRVKQWRQLLTASGRRAHGLFLADGEHLCQEALKVGFVEALLVQTDRREQYEALLAMADAPDKVEVRIIESSLIHRVTR